MGALAMPADNGLLTDLIGAPVEVVPREGWNPSSIPQYGGYSIDNRQIHNEPLVGVVRAVSFTGADFVFCIETGDGWLVTKTSLASNLRVIRPVAEGQEHGVGG